MRDLIPDIIRAKGEVPITYQADAAEYRRRLRDKLAEEVDEFLTADDEHAPEELADVLEVVYALAANLGVSRDQLEKVREDKAAARGGFAERIVWSGIQRTSSAQQPR